MSVIDTIFTLLILFQLKHFLADYPLQTPYMLRKFLNKGWAIPLACHAGVHALFTGFIVYAFTSWPELAIKLALFDFMVHFIMDRLKASPQYLGKYKALSGNEYKRLLGELVEMQKLVTLDPNLEIRNAMDTVKIQKQFKDNQYFWYALGLDQAVHHLTHYVIIYLMFGGM